MPSYTWNKTALWNLTQHPNHNSPQAYWLAFAWWVTLQVNSCPSSGVKATLWVRWNCHVFSKARSVCSALGISIPFFRSWIWISGGWNRLTWQIKTLSFPYWPGSRLYTLTTGGAERNNDCFDLDLDLFFPPKFFLLNFIQTITLLVLCQWHCGTVKTFTSLPPPHSTFLYNVGLNIRSTL